ncbi:CG11164 [Drosophila busckii]|uniref:Ribonuclease H2 subunit B n=1 Tax=Drosophila busckii TaxID=30019 RepID=A0A0M5J571_DROBS|nr:ribonuclease H2 subunit B [Drosophila busckii]ALC42318.1 CG11164 [Drosophila busckii]
MSKKSTRSTKLKSDPDAVPKKASVCAIKKVLFIAHNLLHGEQKICLERFYHPGKGRNALFATLGDSVIMEVLEYAESRRSWLLTALSTEVCSNGRIYITAPIDLNFLALHQLRKHCSQRAISLDSISEDSDTNRLLTKFVNPETLKCVADVKTSGEQSFYKYNAARTMAWLALKTRQVMTVLRKKQVHCGRGAKSQNYVQSEKLADGNDVNEMDYTRMACDYVGRYLDADLHEELTRYLHIPSEIQALVEEQSNAQKRKSQQSESKANSKKIKLAGEDAASKLRQSGLVDSEEPVTSPTAAAPTPLKERSLTAKEKALAKGAKGSKSIASFFKAK